MGFRKKTIRDIEIAGKVVLVRVDYNVPMKDGEIVEDMRIRASVPTIKYLLDNGAKRVILMSHLGRPDGEVKTELSLAPCLSRLSSFMPEVEMLFCPHLNARSIKLACETLSDGGVLMIENLRFSPEEERNSEIFAEEILNATGADVFVQEGFAVIHRAHASTEAMPRLAPVAVSGFLVENEVSTLEGSIKSPEHPLLVIIGGAKVEDKAPMIEQFLPIADEIFVGGKIAADGYIPTDPKVYVAEDFATDITGAKLDIGEKSTIHLVNSIKDAKTIVWNGTMGLNEQPEFAKGSLAAAEAIGTNNNSTSIIGGGDTAGYVEGLMKSGMNYLRFSLISTGGGASLELLSGKKLPGLEVLDNSNI